MIAKVFISYRRRDQVVYAQLLREFLVERLGSDNIFFDTESIVSGADFISAIEDAIPQCACLIAVIGPEWATGMEKPVDYVRLEIEAALRHEIPVLPVFIAEVNSVPSGLPSSVAPIQVLHGIHLRPKLEERIKDLGAVHSSIMRYEGERVRRAKKREPVTSFDKNSHADATDLYDCGLRSIRSQELDVGINFLVLAARNGNIRACKLLVNIYGGDVVKTQNLREVARWTIRAAELGDAESRSMAGMLFVYGIGVEQNFETAERWLRAAAGENDSLARKLLSELMSLLGRWNLKVMTKTKAMEFGLKKDLRDSWIELDSARWDHF